LSKLWKLISWRSSPEAKAAMPLLRAKLDNGEGTAARVEVTLPPLKTPVGSKRMIRQKLTTV
jgi:type IV secretory pathway ATPase VirB11/archaellum biosynthesis ATPase